MAVFLPLPPEVEKVRLRCRSVALVFAVGLVLTLLGTGLVFHRSQTREKLRREGDAHLLVAALQDRLESLSLPLSSVALRRDELRGADTAGLVQQLSVLLASSGGLQARARFGFARFTPRGATIEAMVSAQQEQSRWVGQPLSSLARGGSIGQSLIPGHSPSLFPTLLAARDLLTDAEQSSSGRAAAVLYTFPVQEGGPYRLSPAGSPQPQGWLFVWFPVSDLMQDVLIRPLREFENLLDVRLYFGQQPRLDRLLYDSRNLAGPGTPLLKPLRYTFEAGGTPWLLELQFSPHPYSLQRTPWPLVLAAGLAFTLAATLLVLLSEYRNRSLCQALRRLEREQAVQQTLEERLRLMSSAFALMSEGLMLNSQEGEILYVNPAYCRITGYSADQLVGENFHIVHSDMQDHLFYEQMRDQLLREGIWEGEIWDRRRSGEVFPVKSRILMVRNDQSEPLAYINVISDMSALREKDRQLEYMLYHDELTELPNFRLALLTLTKTCLGSSQKVAVYAMAIDGLQQVIASFGSHECEQAFKAVVERLRPLLGPQDLMARYEGFSFVLLRVLSNDAGPELFARTLIDILKSPVSLLSGIECRLHGWVGFSLFPDHSSQPERLFQQALTALSDAQQAPEGLICSFQPAMITRRRRRLQIEAALEKALDQDGLQVWFQPQVNCHGLLLGAEALLRWTSLELGPVSPAEFIPIAEVSGLIQSLGAWVLLRAAQHWQQWERSGLSPGRLAVNVSSQQFLDPRQSLPDLVRHVICSTQLDTASLELEITESCLMPSVAAQEQMQELAAMGIPLAVDDFGTGYSSLSVLHRFPVSKLKIDRAFVTHVDQRESSQTLVRSTVALARGLGLSLLAEGVERNEELAFLRSQGCEAFQGYLFSRPLPAQDFERLLQSGRILSILPVED